MGRSAGETPRATTPCTASANTSTSSSAPRRTRSERTPAMARRSLPAEGARGSSLVSTRPRYWRSTSAVEPPGMAAAASRSSDRLSAARPRNLPRAKYGPSTGGIGAPRSANRPRKAFSSNGALIVKKRRDDAGQHLLHAGRRVGGAADRRGVEAVVGATTRLAHRDRPRLQQPEPAAGVRPLDVLRGAHRPLDPQPQPQQVLQERRRPVGVTGPNGEAGAIDGVVVR